MDVLLSRVPMDALTMEIFLSSLEPLEPPPWDSGGGLDRPLCVGTVRGLMYSMPVPMVDRVFDEFVGHFHIL